MAALKILTSLHGRLLGLSASGALVDKSGDAMVTQGDSSNAALSGAKTRTFLETISSSGATLFGFGLSIVASATGHSAMNFTIPLPDIAGRIKEIYLDTSASTIVISATALLAFGASVNSSALTISGAAGTRGTTITLRSASTSRWLYMNRAIA